MWTYFAIAVGGTLGCWARFAQTQLVQAVYGRDFPYATMSINVIGSFVMGFLFVETLERLTLPPALRTGILTGVLGGYTTFSTFEMETVFSPKEESWPKQRSTCFCPSDSDFWGRSAELTSPGIYNRRDR